MEKLLGWMFIAYGLSNIVVYGSIFSTPRKWIANIAESRIPIINSIGEFIKDMTSCMMCFGFHAGWFLSIFMWSPTHEMFMVSTSYSWFFDAFLASGAVWLINDIAEYLESKTNK